MNEELQPSAEFDSSEPLESALGDSAPEENQETPEIEASEAVEIAADEPVAVDSGEPDEQVVDDTPQDERHQPDVIDLKALLKPIAGENPSGENLRYSGLYDEIADARRADDNLNQGAWQTELKT